ncbi:MAG: hypothetical protein WD274_08665 [Acidimicrobiia bacterium]
MRVTDRSVEDHINSLPEGVREDFKAIDDLTADVFSGELRVLWEGKLWGGTDQEIIGYGDFTYENSNRTVEWFKVGLAAQKNHLSLYVNAVEDGEYLSRTYGDRLGKVKVGAASIGFKDLSALDLGELRAMLDHARRLME